jgi:hypothetical protein
MSYCATVVIAELFNAKSCRRRPLTSILNEVRSMSAKSKADDECHEHGDARKE